MLRIIFTFLVASFSIGIIYSLIRKATCYKNHENLNTEINTPIVQENQVKLPSYVLINNVPFTAQVHLPTGKTSGNKRPVKKPVF